MASIPIGSRVSVEEYLKTVYRPDCDYVDGVTEERNLGTWDHSWIQTNVASFFRGRFKETGLAAVVECRFRVSPTCYRIPDVMVLRGKSSEQILTRPPLLCIEVRSPEDRLQRIETRIKEYLDLGVPAVWLIDPPKRTVSIYRSTGITESADPVPVDGTALSVPFEEIFD